MTDENETQEMRDLAARMAEDEARDGNFTAAAELKSFAENGPIEEPRVPVVGPFAAKPVPWDHPDADPARDLAAFIQAGKDAGWTTSGMPKPVVGPTAARALREAGVPEEAFVERSPEPGGFAIGQGAVGGQLPCGPPKPIPELDAVAARVSTVDWSVLGPGLVAAMQARQHVWNAGAGSLRDCYCLHGRDHTEQPLSELQAWVNEQTTDLRADIERAVATVDAAPAFRAPEPPIVSRAAVEQALAQDLLQSSFIDLNGDPQEALAAARELVERGWVPGTKRCADAVDEITRTALKERVLGARDDVVGYVWPRPAMSGTWRGQSVHREPDDTPKFDTRDEAIGWVLEQDKEAHRG